MHTTPGGAGPYVVDEALFSSVICIIELLTIFTKQYSNVHYFSLFYLAYMLTNFGGISTQVIFFFFQAKERIQWKYVYQSIILQIR